MEEAPAGRISRQLGNPRGSHYTRKFIRRNSVQGCTLLSIAWITVNYYVIRTLNIICIRYAPKWKNAITTTTRPAIIIIIIIIIINVIGVRRDTVLQAGRWRVRYLMG
jgi:hypothetical protein